MEMQRSSINTIPDLEELKLVRIDYINKCYSRNKINVIYIEVRVHGRVSVNIAFVYYFLKFLVIENHPFTFF